MREQSARFRSREVNISVDGFVAFLDGPGRTIVCARAMLEAVREHGLELHLGVRSGECEARGSDAAGLTVHSAARVCAHAEPGIVTMSRTVADLVAGSRFAFEGLREHDLSPG